MSLIKFAVQDAARIERDCARLRRQNVHLEELRQQDVRTATAAAEQVATLKAKAEELEAERARLNRQLSALQARRFCRICMYR